jgi:hypothetical protein
MVYFSAVDPKLILFLFGSGSYFDLYFGSGFGSGLFMNNTFEMQIILTSQKSKFFENYIF